MGRAGTKAERLQSPLHFTGAVDLAGMDYPEIEAKYKRDTPESHRKRFGQFFTPAPIAELMCDWILSRPVQSVLDPAVGLGIFPSLLSDRGDFPVVGLDLDGHVLKYARTALPSRVELIHSDFLTWNDPRTFDAAIANPPYLRHHDFNYDFDVFDEIGERSGIKLSKLTNIYALFVLEICRRLNPGGRAAIIIPTEWTNANFGTPLKHYLVERGYLRELLYFTHESLPFLGALTTACVLLIEDPSNASVPGEVTTVFLDSPASIRIVRHSTRKEMAATPHCVVRKISRSKLANEKKWDHLLKGGDYERVEGLVQLKSLATTRRGIATGANDFFHISASQATQRGLRPESLSPCVGRSADVEGLVFDKEDHDSLVGQGKRSHLVNMGDPDEAELRYLDEGIAHGLNRRHLLANRKPWYRMEARPAAPIWAAVFGRRGLRFVRNRARVLNLTTFHCIYPKSEDPFFHDALAVCLNSSFVQERSKRQHRVYGGGLLKVEPKDLLDIEVPNLDKVSPATIRLLADELENMDEAIQSDADRTQGIWQRVDNLVRAAASEAAGRSG